MSLPFIFLRSLTLLVSVYNIIKKTIKNKILPEYISVYSQDKKIVTSSNQLYRRIHFDASRKKPIRVSKSPESSASRF